MTVPRFMDYDLWDMVVSMANSMQPAQVFSWCNIDGVTFSFWMNTSLPSPAAGINVPDEPVTLN